ncbi:hypothetical protein [Microbacterium sp. TPU 3598]|uniref:hypothetical protein n=1 Tax=Microbacterium sp. TPU 3598 TaxID=1938334 RepID=UPI000BBAB5ED|nr:hypothetical protein [Microbacterium sp. TPU 3598]
MPVPEYSTREEWIAAARSAAARSANEVAITRFDVPVDVVDAVINAEAAGADENGTSRQTPEEVAHATGASVRLVRLLRAGMMNSGLVAVISVDPAEFQLQLPRPVTFSAPPHSS